MMFINISSVLIGAVFAIQAASSPLATQAVAASVTAAMINPFPTAEGGALDPHPDLPPAIAAGPETYTISITNMGGVPLSTAHYINHGPTQVPSLEGNPLPGVLAVGANHILKAPKKWAGALAIGEARYPLGGEASLIEGSFTEQGADWMGAFDVSYITGFSVPIMCYCVKGNAPLSGCTEKLFARSACPTNDYNSASGVCRNPRRGDKDATKPTPFFAPCSGKAYTFESDIGAESNGECQSGTVRCEVYSNH